MGRDRMQETDAAWPNSIAYDGDFLKAVGDFFMDISHPKTERTSDEFCPGRVCQTDSDFTI